MIDYKMLYIIIQAIIPTHLWLEGHTSYTNYNRNLSALQNDLFSTIAQ
jgi:hypothetical protein